MGQKINGLNTAAFKFIVCVVFIFLFSETAFAHVPDLTLNFKSDIRLETVCSYDVIVGYNLYVRKKPGIESVMLTDPTGNYALRSLVWNKTNGNERRDLSGKPLSDPYSRYSIISSTPIQDCQFGIAFVLFIPSNVVYGNPSSVCGPVSLDIMRGIQFNIRTFDHKYGDPNWGRFQNNMAMINPPAGYARETRYHEYAAAYPFYNNAEALKRELSKKVSYDEFLNRMDHDDLKSLLIYILWEMEGKPGM